MNIKFICTYILLFLNISFGQSKFDHFLNYVDSLPYNQKEVVIDSFLAVSSNNTTLFIENNSVYFFYLGEAELVYINGNCKEMKGFSKLMTKIPETDLHYYKWNIPDKFKTQFPAQLQFELFQERDLLSLVDKKQENESYRFKLNSLEPINAIYYYNIMIDPFLIDTQ